MKYLALFVLLFAAQANAQDIVDRPAGTTSATVIQATDPNVETTWENCLIFDGADATVVGNRFECMSILDTVTKTTNHTITLTTGDVVVRAVTVNTVTGLVSDPSPNSKAVEFRPMAPMLLSGNGARVEDLS